MRSGLLGVSAAALLSVFRPSAQAAVSAPHPITSADIAAIKAVTDPVVDPSGDWVAYVVRTTDVEADKSYSHIWMSRWDGTATVQLTGRAKESESAPRWSPDGKSLAFISSRGDAHDEDRVWLLPRGGGEAVPLPGLKGSVEDVVWSPDSRSLALIVHDPDPDAAADDKAEKKPKPVVISRFKFMEDTQGFLRADHSRLWLYEIATGKATRLTTGDFDEALPSFSPDGRTLAFVSNRGPDPDRTYDHNIYTVPAGPAASEPKALTTYPGEDASPDWDSYPAWNPDGKEIAYVQGGPVELFSYGVRKLAVVSAQGGTPRILTPTLDRNVTHPTWSADGRALRFTVEDDRAVTIAAIPAAGGRITPVIGGRQVFRTFSVGGKGHTAVLLTRPDAPAEVFALDLAGKTAAVRPLSRQNDAWLASVEVARTTETRFTSKDGTEVHGFLMLPPHAKAGETLPTVLYNHGGPQAQFDDGFDPIRQILAAHGYAVVSSNPRGSTGRGEAYARAIYADWGFKDVQDALAAVDDAVARGVADPDRLVVGGWSYGGMLTNYVIASDPRFKAAVSGASISNIIAGYGTDQYIRDYEMELGRPWEHPEVWARISFPFLHNDRIVTPTLFMVGDKDMNVPMTNSEQMYQALRSRGLDTGLILYPGEFHGLRRPSFLKDRMDRWLAWYDAHLKSK